MKGAPFDVALLAGGRSRRMGRDKAFLDWGGQPLWEFQLDKLRALRPAGILISTGENRNFPVSPDCRLVPDEKPGLGPLAGLTACLKTAQAPFLLVLAVDMPGMTVDFLEKLVRRARESGMGCVPEIDSFPEPLAAIYPASLAELAERNLETPDRSLRSFVRGAVKSGTAATLSMAGPEASLFRNLNTPADLRG